MTSSDKPESCGLCGAEGRTRFCPVCWGRADDDAKANLIQRCRVCLDGHVATHEPNLPTIKIVRLAPNSYRIRTCDRLADELTCEEALGVIALALMSSTHSERPISDAFPVHPFLRTNAQREDGAAPDSGKEG